MTKIVEQLQSNDVMMSDQKEFDALKRIFPGRIQKVVEQFRGKLEEVVLDVGDALHIRSSDDQKYYNFENITIEEGELKTIAWKVGGFKDNGRTGIDQTLHRVSAKHGTQGELVGVTIRFGRHVLNVADPLIPYLNGGNDNGGSMLVVGAPGSGKSTLLRDMVRVRAAINQKQTCVIDTSGEIGGHSLKAHPCIGSARRFHVPQSRDQERILTEVIRNHSPIDIFVDEMGYGKDVEIAERAARSGTKVIGTVHGKIIQDVMENPVLFPLLGYPDKFKGKRKARPVFGMALQVVAKGKFLIYDDLEQAVDNMLNGGMPHAIKLGKWGN